MTSYKSVLCVIVRENIIIAIKLICIAFTTGRAFCLNKSYKLYAFPFGSRTNTVGARFNCLQINRIPYFQIWIKQSNSVLIG